jgi:hypothetical protein
LKEGDILMLSKFKYFRDSEDGAVTVDWVVLTAAVVGMSVVIVLALSQSTLPLQEKTDTYISGLSFNPD